jgi:geranylgeranyl pyrophosphate synthase
VKGKVVPLRSQGDTGQSGAVSIVIDMGALPREPMQGVEQILCRAAGRVPVALRGRLAAIAEDGDRLCPALFLLLGSAGRGGPGKKYSLAASLEALHLALKTHRNAGATAGLSLKEAILCGDFYFGLALTLASGMPLFIQGMSEVLSRFAAVTINISEERVSAGDRKNHLQRVCDGSASIYALSCSLGAAYSGLEPRHNEALSYYGLYLGMGLHLRREIEDFKFNLHEKKPRVKVGLPLIYTLEKSPRRDKLALLLKGSLSDREYDILLREVNRVKPCSYTERIIDRCFSKAAQSIELLRGNLDPITMQALKSLLGQ